MVKMRASESIHLGTGADGIACLVNYKGQQLVRKIFTQVPKSMSGTYDDPWVAECHAYEVMSGYWDFEGRVPKLLGFGDRTLLVEYINGSTLHSLEDKLTEDELGQLWDHLEITTQMVHLAGITHGDIRTPNIIVHRVEGSLRAVLVDFSRAERQADARNWKATTQSDRAKLDDCFDTIIRQRRTSQALSIFAKLEFGAKSPNLELAAVLECVEPDPHIWAALRTSALCDPLCILALVRNCEKLCPWNALSLVERCLPIIEDNNKFQDQSRVDTRSIVMLHGYKALLRGDQSCRSYLPAAISLCEDILGRLDAFTIGLRYELAKRSIVIGSARPLLEALRSDLQSAVPQNEGADNCAEHLFCSRLARETMLARCERLLPAADRCAAHSLRARMSMKPREGGPCSASCSHHSGNVNIESYLRTTSAVTSVRSLQYDTQDPPPVDGHDSLGSSGFYGTAKSRCTIANAAQGAADAQKLAITSQVSVDVA